MEKFGLFYRVENPWQLRAQWPGINSQNGTNNPLIGEDQGNWIKQTVSRLQPVHPSSFIVFKELMEQNNKEKKEIVFKEIMEQKNNAQNIENQDIINQLMLEGNSVDKDGRFSKPGNQLYIGESSMDKDVQLNIVSPSMRRETLNKGKEVESTLPLSLLTKNEPDQRAKEMRESAMSLTLGSGGKLDLKLSLAPT
ncbi:hypothetical protein AMTR_s00037p00221640 [Amborella trichopoda]|uniref:Uncharacterized protein n=1 Tax=Amborella trichopoda TaxID=13333 RepID=U5D4N8_AMBTC|nr:hypothetical protein AMTR_s00037p00221640 [Amborella trichopoda]